MSEQIKINTIPSLTWNWMKINNDFTSLDLTLAEVSGTAEKVPEGIKITNESFDFSKTNIGSGITNFANPKLDAEKYAPGKDKSDSSSDTEEAKAINHCEHQLYKVAEATVKNPQQITIEGKVSEPLILNFAQGTNSVSIQNIIAKTNSEATIIFVFEGNYSTKNQIVFSRIYAQENSKLHIVKVQLLGNSDLQLDDTAVICDENAAVQFTQIELGGSHVDSGLHVILNGYKSSFVSNVAYLCKENQFLDMNHIVYHYGQKTECNMKVNGSLKDNAVKTYRGTIDFKKGCSGSKGNEMEETLLLNPKVVNKSLPVILCDEEDVEGEHGATIGRLSNDILFYMQTRGISQAEAERLMTLAKVQAVADLIPSDIVKEKINSFLGE